MDANQEIISKLKFLGKIQKEEKINVRYVFMQPNDLATKLSRTFYNKDNRNNTLSFVKEVIESSFDIIKQYMNSEKKFEKTICQNIVKDLELAKIGIANLKDTYISDIKFNCDIETIIENIDVKITELYESDITVLNMSPVLENTK